MQLYFISPWIVYYISIYGQLFILFLAHNCVNLHNLITLM